MKMKWLFILMASAIGTLISCGKHYDANPDSRTKEKISLTGLSAHEVFKTKYDQIQAICQLQDSQNPMREIHWDLLTEPAEEKTLRSVDEQSGFAVSVHFARPQVLARRTYIDQDGVTYRMQNSAEVHVTVKWKHRMDGGQQTGQYRQILVEGIPPVNYQSMTELDSSPANQVTSIGCFLLTKIKTEYQDEFSKDESVK